MKNKYLIGLVVALMLVLSACSGQPTTTSNTVKQPTTSSSSGNNQAPTAAATEAAMPVVVPTSGPTGPLDPALATGADKDALGHVYESLVKMDNGQPALSLASDVTVSEDGLDYIFSLRPGVSFHDGSPFNADAVLANFNRWFDPTNAMHGSATYDTWLADFGGFKGDADSDGKPKSEFDGIEKVDDLTVIVHLNTPDPDLLSKLSDTAFSIISPAALEASGFGSQDGVDGGTGPYKMGTWSGSTLTLEPFSDYWDAALIPSSSMDVTVGK